MDVKCLDLIVLSFSALTLALQLLAVSEEWSCMGVRRSRSVCHSGKCEHSLTYTCSYLLAIYSSLEFHTV